MALDTTKLYGASSLRLDWYIDVATTEAELFVYNADTNALVYNVKSMIGVEIALSQVKVDVLGAVSSVASGVSGAIGNGVGGAINSVLSGIIGATSSLLPQLSTSGGYSSFIAYSLGAPQLHAFYMLQVDTDPVKYGRPLCELETLSNLSGYCLCSNSIVNYSLTLPLSVEADEVNGLLDTGVYLE